MLRKEKRVERVHHGAACFEYRNDAFPGEELCDFEEDFVSNNEVRAHDGHGGGVGCGLSIGRRGSDAL